MTRVLAVGMGLLVTCATALAVLAGPAAAAPVAPVAPAATAAADAVSGDVVAGDAADPAAPPAAAAQNPTVRELLAACKTKTDVCKFHPSGKPTFFLGDPHQVGRTVNNCTGVTQNSTITWSQTVSSTNTVGVTVSAEAGFEEVFKVSIQASYTYAWEVAHTFSQNVAVTVPAKRKAWVSLEVPLARASGQYELHFGSKFYGHYIWYVNNYTQTGPRAGGRANVTIKTGAASC